MFDLTNNGEHIESDVADISNVWKDESREEKEIVVYWKDRSVDEKYEKIIYATALHTCCAERTGALQLACMCASYAYNVLFTERLCLERHEVQV